MPRATYVTSTILLIVLAAAIALAITPKARAAHAVPPPSFTQRQAVTLQPVFRARLAKLRQSKRYRGLVPRARLGRDQLRHGRARDGRVVWAKVRRQASLYWLWLHPRSDEYLYWLSRQRGVEPAEVWGATWRAAGVPQWKQDFLMCIPQYEGGYGQVVAYGGKPILEDAPETWPPGNTVGGWWQDRPGWINGWIAGGYKGPARYGVDSWNAQTAHLAHDPVAMARLNTHLVTQYATGHLC